MDMEILRSVMTVASFAAFVGIVGWAYGPSRKARFEEDARALFREDEDIRERQP